MFKGIMKSQGILSPSFEMVCCHQDTWICLTQAVVLDYFLWIMSKCVTLLKKNKAKKTTTLETTSSACRTVNVNQPSLQ